MLQWLAIHCQAKCIESCTHVFQKTVFTMPSFPRFFLYLLLFLISLVSRTSRATYLERSSYVYVVPSRSSSGGLHRRTVEHSQSPVTLSRSSSNSSSSSEPSSKQSSAEPFPHLGRVSQSREYRHLLWVVHHSVNWRRHYPSWPPVGRMYMVRGPNLFGADQLLIGTVLRAHNRFEWRGHAVAFRAQHGICALEDLRLIDIPFFIPAPHLWRWEGFVRRGAEHMVRPTSQYCPILNTTS